MIRIGYHELFIKIAIEVAERSTCARIHVGTVIVKDQRIISMGWNGVPSGQRHCCDIFEEEYNKLNTNMSFNDWINSKEMATRHHEFAVENEIHSEMNSLIFAAKNGISVNGADAYIVWSPCIDCSKALLQSGIKNVYYNKLYERDVRGLEFLQNNGINCKQIKI